MGLDMYLRSTTDLRPVEGDPGEVMLADDEPTELHYWRKHPNLHGWMEALYRERGGIQEFNCIRLELTAADLDRLEEAVTNGTLPPTTGFFFGESSGSEVERKDDMKAIATAREALAQGLRVYYYSWW